VTVPTGVHCEFFERNGRKFLRALRPELRICVYRGLGPLIDVPWQTGKVYVLIASWAEALVDHGFRTQPIQPLILRLGGEEFDLPVPNKQTGIQSRSRVTAGIWEFQTEEPHLEIIFPEPWACRQSVSVAFSDVEAPERGDEAVADADGVSRVLRGNFCVRTNRIDEIRGTGLYRTVGEELLFPSIDGIGTYPAVMERVAKVSGSVPLNLDFASLHRQLDEIELQTAGASDDAPVGMLDYSVNLSWPLVEAVVDAEVQSIAADRLQHSKLLSHCVLELNEALDDPRKVQKALKFLASGRRVAVAQDDMSEDSLLYAFKDLIDDLLWIKVPYTTVHGLLDDSQRGIVGDRLDLVCQAAQHNRYRMVFEGGDIAIRKELLRFFAQRNYRGQDFYLQYDDRSRDF